MKRIFQSLFRSKEKSARKRDFEWDHFQEVAKAQFEWMKKKGISIPVMTL